MKKILFITVLAGFATTSCKKDYTCECTTTNSLDPSFNSTSTSSARMKKKDAENWCKSSSNASTFFGSVTTECKLK